VARREVERLKLRLAHGCVRDRNRTVAANAFKVRPGPPSRLLVSALRVIHSKSVVYGLFGWRAGRFTVKMGGFRPGQSWLWFVERKWDQRRRVSGTLQNLALEMALGSYDPS
jgi:hypothetical protein